MFSQTEPIVTNECVCLNKLGLVKFTSVMFISVGIKEGLKDVIEVERNLVATTCHTTHTLSLMRTGHNPPRGPSGDWWVLTTANAARSNGLNVPFETRGSSM
jgi:hypothetical protein